MRVSLCLEMRDCLRHHYTYNPIHTSMWSWCKLILRVHYNPLAPFVAIIHNTKGWGWGGGGGGGGAHKYDIYTDLGYAFRFLEYCSDA